MISKEELRAHNKAARHFIILTVISILISGISLCLIPLCTFMPDYRWLPYTLGAVFWTGVIASFTLSFFTKSTLKRYYAKLVLNGVIPEQWGAGIITFSLKRSSIIIYSVILACIACIALDLIWGFIPEVIMFPIIAITLLSVTLHCVFDGRYYKVYKLIKESFKNEKHLTK